MNIDPPADLICGGATLMNHFFSSQRRIVMNIENCFGFMEIDHTLVDVYLKADQKKIANPWFAVAVEPESKAVIDPASLFPKKFGKKEPERPD